MYGLHESPSTSSCTSLFEDDDSRWQAVKDRNANADGFFVYAVSSTKVYCRPVCKARLARRINVTFYPTGREAKAAGFRACKRCRPELDGFMPEEVAVQKIRAFLDNRVGMLTEDPSYPLSLSDMARQAGLSKWHFHRVFKKQTGMTPVQYMSSVRRDPATKLKHDSPCEELSFPGLPSLASTEFSPMPDFMTMFDVSTGDILSEGFSENSSIIDPDYLSSPEEMAYWASTSIWMDGTAQQEQGDYGLGIDYGVDLELL